MNPAADYECLEAFANDERWIASWHPASDPPPPGRPHGSAGICLTSDGDVVLISQDGVRWDLPGGRPEDSETLEDTLRRELLEEACAQLRVARLLGYCQSECVDGPEKGLVLVRSLWRADVDLEPWAPQFEVLYRRTVAPADFLASLGVDDGLARIFRRALVEAGVG